MTADEWSSGPPAIMASAADGGYDDEDDEEDLYRLTSLPPEVNIEVPSDSDSSRRPSKASYGGGVGSARGSISSNDVSPVSMGFGSSGGGGGGGAANGPLSSVAAAGGAGPRHSSSFNNSPAAAKAGCSKRSPNTANEGKA